MCDQVNESVLRPASMELNDLQVAEELIKQEMISMMHYDCLHHPAAGGQLQRAKARGPASASNNALHIAYLDAHAYNTVSTEDMDKVCRASRTRAVTLIKSADEKEGLGLGRSSPEVYINVLFSVRRALKPKK